MPSEESQATEDLPQDEVVSCGILPRGCKVRRRERVAQVLLNSSRIVGDQGSRVLIIESGNATRSQTISGPSRCSGRRGGRLVRGCAGCALGDGRLGCCPGASPLGSKGPAECRRHQAGRPRYPDHRPRGSVPGLPRGGCRETGSTASCRIRPWRHWQIMKASRAVTSSRGSRAFETELASRSRPT